VAPYTPGPWYQVSKVETPIKVVEYMAMGKPVVMSRISEENVLTWGNGGLIVTPGNVSELASGIIALIEDEKSRKSFGENGRKFVEKDYSWQKISKKLVDIYQSLNEYN
jgi:glycosyltransferase involved in cell wall biosynthesis